MVTREQLDALRERHVNARTEEERDAVRAEMARLCEENAEAVARISAEQVKEDIEDIKSLSVRERLADVLPGISLAYIAKTYFNKSRAWLYQKVNGLNVNGKPARFTSEEIDTLNYAFDDMIRKLTKARIS